ncbi:bifunctional (p)ppGpp synthetase/guanosine-3',5'-bis(diphosphate) 3'-pyrophosphohydrolase [Novosphingobium sp. MMS21-SN21R]|uniref:RelA/SpoT family protein n=1 Tax=Novosphingobium sp. MMS21-SN21R TaxID=2969298 RepID=UPI0028887ECD|nr:bifunctional (p)ppGpp synthetase/guanosine-3',5'-bis(diphosphate) 3'-pyrophosphohydrolase [Novosphingobium sp. MMS21-SN21R]MDT0508628.1 bifunctional (p)ppGpp synthetase/guanosine-3',5'-bis(diphosphate) 3'-pyrophosphohydrolase [Novosphingobium sp. MMS21-SN21R]
MLRQYELVERVLAYDPDADEAMLNRAYVFTVQKHGTQKRASGDPYFSHPVEVAGLMTELKLDQDTIITALLHDTVEDTLTTVEDIERLFGPDVARLVDGVTKLSKIETMSESERAAENLRKFLLAMSEDLRVLLVKLADRLHNMRTLHYIRSDEKRRRISRETMEIYAPLAERVGMYEYMREMQLLAFEQIEPEAYATITGRLAAIRSEAGAQVDSIALEIKQSLAEAGLRVEVSGREKHPYSIWRKMAERHVSFEQITDIMAFRVVTENEDDCYQALGILHRAWQMIPGRFKDYISTPKMNGYRSLHTSLIYSNAMRVEVQIKTREMHELNEYGLAAHWSYKQGGTQPDAQVGWLRDLVEILDASHDAEELLENTRMAIYQDRIFAFTPKGSLFQLPKGATPIDFAFAVHTNLGAAAVGAKINGRHVPLRTQLGNGDVVEIIKSRNSEPQLSWLGFVVTGKARAAIRRFVRQKERGEVAAIGRKLYEEIVERLPTKIGKKATADAIKRLKLGTEEDFMFAIGSAKIDDRQVMEALVPGSAANLPEEDWPRQQRAIAVRGLTPGMAFKLADCCHPVPGDRIVGLRRPEKGVEVHAIDCMVLADGVDADWIDLAWDARTDGAIGRLRAELYNRPGTLAEMAGIFAKNHANVVNLEMTQRENPFHTYEVDLEVRDLAHLTRIVSALRASEAVAQAERI